MNKITKTLTALVAAVGLTSCIASQDAAYLAFGLNEMAISPNSNLTLQNRANSKVLSNYFYNQSQLESHKENRPLEKQVQRQNMPTQRRKAIQPEFYVYNQWVDSNHDGAMDKSELRGLGKTSFGLGESINFCFFNRDYAGELVLRKFDSQGVKIDETNHYFNEPHMAQFDSFEENVPGDYTLSATMNGRTLIKKITLKKGYEKEHGKGTLMNMGLNFLQFLL